MSTRARHIEVRDLMEHASSRSEVPRQPTLPTGEEVGKVSEGVGSAPAGSAALVGSSKGQVLVQVTDDQKTVISRNPPLSIPEKPIRRTHAEQVAQQLTGERLGPFQLEEYIGGGGMGAVFRATDSALGRTVAVKVVSGASHDEDALRRFQNEAQSAARLDHPNIARVYYVGEDRGWHYIVFEYVQGVNIRDLVAQRGPLPVAEVLAYTCQVAAALDHAWQRGVVHRDVKPSNVLVTDTGVVKLVDMGLARLRQVDTTDELTASGVTLGTFDYISPEQARDPRLADVRSDLYSLGCTIFFMLTGRPPFAEGTVLQKLLSHSSEPPPDPRQFRDDIPDELAAIVLRLLAKNPADRFPTPGELIAQVTLLADRLGVELPGVKPTVVITSPVWGPAWHEMTWWAVGLGSIAVLALLIHWLSGTSAVLVPRPNLPLAMGPAPVEPTTRPAPPTSEASGGTESARSSAGSVKHTSGGERATPETAPSPASASSVVNGTSNDVSSIGNSSSPPSAAPATPMGASSRASATDTPGGQTMADSPVQPPPTNGGSSSNVTAPAADATRTNPAPSTGVGTPVGGSGTSSGSGNIADPAPASNSRQPSNGSTTPAELPMPRRIVVTPNTVENIPGDAVAVPTLDAAVKRALELGELEAIELWFDGPLSASPLQISGIEHVQIRAGSGFQPSVWFKPQLGLSSAERRMVFIRGGDVVWSGVHVVMELPTEPAQDWSVFALEDPLAFQFREATVTIVNGEVGGRRHEAVAFVEVLPPRPRSRMDMEINMGTLPMSPTMRIPPVIRLENVAVRGQATLLRVPSAQPLSFFWENGLFISNERLLEMGGTTDSFNWDAELQLQLHRVTAVMDQGLVRVQLDSNGPRLLDANVELNDCVLLTSVDSPLFEYRGVSSVERAEKSLKFRGDRNFYPSRMAASTSANRSTRRIRWRITTATGLVREYGFDQKDAEWYEEKSAKETVLWKELPPSFSDVPPHRQGKAQYELDTSLRNPARAAGYDTNTVPNFPPFPTTAAATDRNSPTMPQSLAK